MRLASAVLLAALPLSATAVVPAALAVAVPHAVTAQPPDANPAVEVLYERSFSVREGGALAVDLGAEAVVVETGAGTRATVRVEGRGRDARAEFERRRFSATYGDGHLRVRTQPEQRSGWRWGTSRASFTVTIEVPRRFDVAVNVGSGSVSVGSLEGDLAVDTGSGSVTLGDVRGAQIRANTGSGSVSAGRLTGRVRIDTGSGSVQVAAVRGALAIDTGSGSVSVGRLDAETTEISTGSGGVRVGLAPGARADLVAQGGRVQIADALDFQGRVERDEARGRIGGGGPTLRIGTGSGGIRLDAVR